MDDRTGLEERRQWLASFPETNPSPVIEVDENGEITFANKATLTTLKGLGLPENPALFVPVDKNEILRLLRESAELQIYREIKLKDAFFSENIALNRELRVARIYASNITDRKKAEEALRKSEEEYRQLVEHAPASIYEIASDGLRFIRVNDSMCRILGYTQKEMLEMNPFDILDEESKVRFRERIRKRSKGEDIDKSEAYRVFSKDGRELWVILSVKWNCKGGGALVIAQDITDKRLIEKALKDSEERLRLAQWGAGAGLWDWDVKTGTMTWDSHMFSLFGLEKEKDTASFEMWNRVIHPEDLETANSRITQALNDHIDLFSEYRIILSSGEVRWINALGRGIYDEQGSPMRMSGICIDVTQRIKAEMTLRQSEELFRMVLKSAPVSVAFQNRDLIFQWAYNQRNVRTDEVKGKTDSDLFQPEDAAHLVDLKRRVIETGKEVHEQIWLTINQKRLYLDIYLEPLRDTKGQITGIGIVTVDITGVKNAQQTLIENENRLREAVNLLDAVTGCAQVIIAAQDTNFRYTYFNTTYAAEIRRLTGKELAIGMNMIDLFYDQPKEQRSELSEWSKVLGGECVNKLIAFGEQLAGRKIYNVLHVPIRDANDTVVGAGEVAYDVTQQVLVEEKLRETKEYLDNLITYANAPIIVWDPQFRITLFNQAFEHLTGWKAKEVLGKNLDILLPEHCMDLAMDLIKKAMGGERWESVEIPILHKKGEIRTVLWNSAGIFGPDGKTIVSTIAQGQDITDRKKIESDYRLRATEYAKMNVALEEEIRQRKLSDITLKKTLSLLNASLESTADGILVIDTRGRITGYNQNFMTMWNIPKVVIESGKNETLMNHLLPQLKNPEAFLSSIQEIFVHPARESFDMIEFIDGKIFERYSKPQKLGNRVVGKVWSFRDVTDRKRAEEKLVASVAEKEVLLREIHHRVKNNLQLISGLLDMTRMRTADESTNSILTDMMLKIQTMAQIHTRLYESKQFGKISITKQFGDQISALTNIYSHKGHEISCGINSQEIFLPVDQALPCALVVNEILSNAYKHAFKGRKKGTVEISAVQKNGQIHIIVRDNGIGMPGNFDISRSTSLGLKLIRTLVQHQLKGSLVINSHDGTEVIVEFPLNPAGT